jgi:hypothetical protein
VARQKLPYSEGDWFAIPLGSRGFGLGVVARMNGRGVVFGYFFGPRRDTLPALDDTEQLTCEQAVLARQFGDPGLLQGEWPLLGRSKNWQRDQWPMPAFGRIAVDRSRALRVEYSETDINEVVREIPITVEEALMLPEDGLSGSGALEIRLSQLLSEA